MADFDTILIANRGEIACRVMRTARAMGIRTVAVYSDADANAPHVKLADTSVHIGASEVGQSYLRPDKILEAAKASGAGAIHPGYGFLSENAEFAKAVEKAGLVFIGPPVKAIDVMGDKARAKRAMIDAEVPCVPGYQGKDQSDTTLITEAKGVGFPLMVKAAAGGGGRGMRLVHSEETLADAIKLARSEAENAFGSGELIIEKAIIRPRHVEIQVFADSHGNVLHFAERDCSVQRRHQKVIEEAPCPVMTEELRAAMGKAAVEAARAVDYRGAGTVEFLLGQDGSFYFLEMNTRLQVEHPVTEEITGLDLVALQIKVARGEPIGISQEDVSINGHAIEVRLYAEDPDSDFLPSTGPALLWKAPSGEGIRVDDGLETGGEISPYYDPMVAKIIAHGPTREDARKRLVRALEATALFGPKTNRDFLIDALQREAFISGQATTAFIAETYGEDGFSAPSPSARDYAIAAAIQCRLSLQQSQFEAIDVSVELLNWSSAGKLQSVVQYAEADEVRTYEVRVSTDSSLEVESGSESTAIKIIELDGSTAKIEANGSTSQVTYKSETDGNLYLATPGLSFDVTDLTRSSAAGADESGGGTVLAPMHGQLLEILVEEGTSVAKGDRLAVLEAMKMQHEILAEVSGTVAQVVASAGSQIAADDLILEITPDEESEE